MLISVRETLNWPGASLDGAPKVTGDDRFGFDEAAGTAWVLDGATDLGPYRLFEREESDAAWIAEAYNGALMQNAPTATPDLKPYFSDIMSTVRKCAEKEARLDLDRAAKSTLPIAAGIWAYAAEDTLTLVRLGDCVALTRNHNGKVEVFEHRASADLERETSKKLNAMSPEDRIKGLRDIRATQNTEPRHAIFGLSPNGADNLVIEKRALSDLSHILLMTDGLWRLVEVYGLMTPETVFERAISEGVEALARDLRAFERSDAQDKSTRIKASDDACGVLIDVL